MIEQWQDLLREWQSIRKGGSIAIVRFQAQLLNAHSLGASYAEIASWINDQIREASREADAIEDSHLPNFVTPEVSWAVEKYKLSLCREQIIRYLAPHDRLSLTHPDLITPQHVRERIRSLLKKSS